MAPLPEASARKSGELRSVEADDGDLVRKWLAGQPVELFGKH